MIQLRTTGVDDTQTLAGVIARLAREGDLVVLVGEMGAGKTAFAQGFGRGLGVADSIVSPTFNLVREYSARLRMHHVDVYRLDQLHEVLDLGLSELLDDGGVTLIEWGDMVAPLLPNDMLEIRLDFGEDDDIRLIEIQALGGAWADRHDELRRALGHWRTEA